ncbi:unnamed protein product [Rhizophagus irregularis]|nr:unnamed protein product [Rhizophagus irregularis]
MGPFLHHLSVHPVDVYTSHRHKSTTILNSNQHALYLLHFEKKRKNNNLIFVKKNEWKLAWIYEIQKQLRETQADSSIHAVSIDPGVRAPFTWYSPTKDRSISKRRKNS